MKISKKKEGHPTWLDSTFYLLRIAAIQSQGFSASTASVSREVLKLDFFR